MTTIFVVFLILTMHCLCEPEKGGCLKEHLIKEIERNLKELKSIHDIDKVISRGLTGETYIRWGRTTCPNDSSLVYSGYAGGKGYHTGGSGSNFLCLPKDPEWNKFTEGGGAHVGHIYGVEYQIQNDKPYSRTLNDKDMPCSVCLSKRSTILIVPGKVTCYDGWHKEFSGYLMSEGNTKPIERSSSEYICVDEQLEAVPGGDADLTQGVVYPVEAVCGQLKCPLYVPERQLTCVVCSR